MRRCYGHAVYAITESSVKFPRIALSGYPVDGSDRGPEEHEDWNLYAESVEAAVRRAKYILRNCKREPAVNCPGCRLAKHVLQELD